MQAACVQAAATLVASLAIVCFVLTVSCSTLWPNVAQAQLIDPNNRCYYAPGSTVCQSLPPPAPQQQSQRPVVNQCEAQCGERQQQCMSSCTPQHDWYRCFAYCGDVRTTCMHACPM